MPGLQINLSNSFQYIANRESGSLYDKFGNLVCSFQDGKRLMQGLSEREPSFGEYLQTEIDWRLPAMQVTGTIQPGWSILDADSNAFVVINVDPPSSYQTVWMCSCRSVQVLGLINQVDWRQVNQTTDAYGDRVTDPTTFPLGGHYPARIQPATADIVDMLGKRGLLNHFIIYILPSIALNYGDLFIDTANNNTQYKVVAWRTQKQLAEAFTILAEVQP